MNKGCYIAYMPGSTVTFTCYGYLFVPNVELQKDRATPLQKNGPLRGDPPKKEKKGTTGVPSEGSNIKVSQTTSTPIYYNPYYGGPPKKYPNVWKP